MYEISRSNMSDNSSHLQQMSCLW